MNNDAMKELAAIGEGITKAVADLARFAPHFPAMFAFPPPGVPGALPPLPEPAAKRLAEKLQASFYDTRLGIPFDQAARDLAQYEESNRISNSIKESLRAIPHDERKIIEHAIIGLRDGWASREDAGSALALLAASRPDLIDALEDADRERDRRDADRWREAIRHIGATANHALGHRFTASCLDPIPGADLMHGGISQHFTEAIDASIVKRKAAP